MNEKSFLRIVMPFRNNFTRRKIYVINKCKYTRSQHYTFNKILSQPILDPPYDPPHDKFSTKAHHLCPLKISPLSARTSFHSLPQKLPRDDQHSYHYLTVGAIARLSAITGPRGERPCRNRTIARLEIFWVTPFCLAMTS